VPELRRKGPVWRRLRELQHRLFSDRAEEPVFHALGREARTAHLGALLLQALRSKCSAFIREWLAGHGRVQPQVFNKALEWLDGEGDKALGDWDISRDPPYFGIRVPDIAEEKYLYVWLDAPIGYLASLQNYCAKQGLDWRQVLAEREQIHFIGKDIIYFHTLFWPAMLKFAGAPYKEPDHVYVHGFIQVSGEKDVQVARHRNRPAALPAARHERRLAALLHRRQAQRRRRGHRFQPGRFHRARQQRPLRQVHQHREPRAAGSCRRNSAASPPTRRASVLKEWRTRPPRSPGLRWREFGKALRRMHGARHQVNALSIEKPWDLAKAPARKRAARVAR
jgi:methionyl-tRNA synthetase